MKIIETKIFYLIFKSKELESKIRENSKNPLEEYVIYSSNNNYELREMDMAKYPLVKEQLKALQQSLTKLSRSATKALELTKSNVIETLDFGKELKDMLTREDNLLVNDFRPHIKTEFIFSQFISISEQTNSEVRLQEDGVVEPINVYLDLITAYKVSNLLFTLHNRI